MDMNLPRPVDPLLKAVWEECDPKQATAGPYYKREFGLPPRELRIYQATQADWERAMIKPPYVCAWRFVGGPDVEIIEPDDLPDYSVVPTGMYWPVGTIDFCIDSEHKRAVFTYVLGPRYGRGYKVTFKDLETLELVPGMSGLRWRS
jgi:hypothetical protein